jgi:hypothetical protein
MPVETRVDRARTRVRTERGAIDAKLDAIDAKLDAIDEFVDRVEELSTDCARSSAGGPVATGSGLVRADPATGSRCRTVRTAFAETIRPHSVAGVDGTEPVLETVREEFTDALAVALAPTTGASFTPELERTVVATAESRRSEATAVRRALGREEARLDDPAATVDDVVAWIVDANETPLTDLGFDALRRRHETIAGRRDRCEDAARERQTFLRGTTNDGLGAGVRHRSLVPYPYREFPVDHPVLSTVASLGATCRECQRAIRDHPVRRA